MSETAWPQAFYSAPLISAILTRGDAELERAENFLWARLGLRAGMRVLDQCCGEGQLSHRLAARGCSVVGVDLSAPFIEVAGRGSAASAEFHCADASHFVCAAPCDAAFNWGTGFGNLATDAGNEAMLASAAASLRAGAAFLLDYYNVAGVLAGFREELSYTRRLGEREVRVRRRSRLDLAAGTMHQRWTLDDGAERIELPETTTRLYLPRELATLLEGAGFEVEAFFGDAEGSPLSLDSARCIVLARLL